MFNLTIPEASLIVDALNGVLAHTDISASDYLVLNVQDAVAVDSLDEKWGVDARALLANLQSLSEADARKLLNAVKRFWSASPHADMREGLAAAGLIT